MGGQWSGGWCGRIKIKTISAFNYVEVEVEADLGNMTIKTIKQHIVDSEAIR